MKKIIGIISAIVVVAIAGFLFYSNNRATTADAENSSEETTPFTDDETTKVKNDFNRNEFGVSPDKEWVVEYENDLDQEGLPEGIATVSDVVTGDAQDVKVDVIKNQVVVSPPDNGYEAGGHYILELKKSLPFTNGESSGHNVTIDFRVVRKDKDVVKMNPELITVAPEVVKGEKDKSLSLKKSSQTKGLKEGDIIIVEGETIYDSKAYKIKSVKTSLRTVAVTVTEPGFDELFEEIDIYKKIQITSDDIELVGEEGEIKKLSVSSRQTQIASSTSKKKKPDYKVTGQSLKNALDIEATKEKFAIQLNDFKVEDQKNRGSILLDGDITFHRAEINIDHSFSVLGGVKRFYFDVTQNANQDLHTKISYYINEKNFHKAKHLSSIKTKKFGNRMKLTKKPILIPVAGPIAVRGEMFLNVQWDVNGEVEVNLEFEQSGKVGIEKVKSSYKPFVQFESSKEVSFEGRAKAGIESGVRLDLGIEAYRVVGAELQTEPSIYAKGGALHQASHQSYTTIAPVNPAEGQELKKQISSEKLSCYRVENGLLIRNRLSVNLLSKIEVFNQELPLLKFPTVDINTCNKFIQINSELERIKLKPGESIDLSLQSAYMDYFSGKQQVKKSNSDNLFKATSLNEEVASYDPEKNKITIRNNPLEKFTYIKVSVEEDGEEYIHYIPVEILISEEELKANQAPSISSAEGFVLVKDLFSKLQPLTYKDVYGKDLLNVTDPKSASKALRDETFEEVRKYATNEFFEGFMKKNYESGFCRECDVVTFPTHDLTNQVNFNVLESEPGYLKIQFMSLPVIETLSYNQLITAAIRYEDGAWKVDDAQLSGDFSFSQKELLAYFGDDVMDSNHSDYTTVLAEFDGYEMYMDMYHSTGDILSSDYQPVEEVNNSSKEIVVEYSYQNGQFTTSESSHTAEVGDIIVFKQEANEDEVIPLISPYTAHFLQSEDGGMRFRAMKSGEAVVDMHLSGATDLGLVGGVSVEIQ